MSPDDVQTPEESAEVTHLPIRNEMHYDRRVFERVAWTHGAAHMQANHGITSDVADEALGDPSRVVIDPDYNSTSGRSVRIIGFSTRAQDIITVIVVEDGDVEYGVNSWVSNAKDRHIYNAGSHDEEEGEANEQDED